LEEVAHERLLMTAEGKRRKVNWTRSNFLNSRTILVDLLVKKGEHQWERRATSNLMLNWNKNYYIKSTFKETTKMAKSAAECAATQIVRPRTRWK
jgi:hypothetical protein